jgi:methyltransferase (TIGR00027 family)
MTPNSLEEQDELKPISKTAFYCCGVRMRDAEGPSPVCGDSYARLFMSEEGLAILAAFDDETRPNASNVARHRVIDDLLRRELAADPALLVVIVGAGFDTRAYRLKGGVWVELDEPQVIAYKEERLPASRCGNELRRVPVDFSTESLEEKLAPFAGRGRALVVVEGVLMYLDEGAIRDLLATLRRLFPRHTLVCDLMNRRFFEKYGQTIHKKISGMGAPFKFKADDPERLFLECGYRRASKISVVEKSLEFQRAGIIPRLVLKTLLRRLAAGYAIHVFETV